MGAKFHDKSVGWWFFINMNLQLVFIMLGLINKTQLHKIQIKNS